MHSRILIADDHAGVRKMLKLLVGDALIGAMTELLNKNANTLVTTLRTPEVSVQLIDRPAVEAAADGTEHSGPLDGIEDDKSKPN